MNPETAEGISPVAYKEPWLLERAWRRVKAVLTPWPESNFIIHARRELTALGYFNGDEMNEAMARDVMALLGVFSLQGHSGFSAAHCVALFKTLASFEPLGPLTGEDSEWAQVGEDMLQNVRCSHVFKDFGEAYDINGIVWEDRDGGRYTNGESRVPVTFPYTPKIEYRKDYVDA